MLTGKVNSAPMSMGNSNFFNHHPAVVERSSSQNIIHSGWDKKNNQSSGKIGATSDSGSIIDQIVALLKKLSRQSARDITNAADSLDPEKILKANRSMSNYYLNNQFISRLIGKITNSLDKMINLQ